MLAKEEMQPLATVKDAKNYMWASHNQFAAIVQDKELALRYFAIGLHVIEQVPRLLECPRSSFRNALVEAARLDLEPNSVQQLCWIIPRAQQKGGRPIARLEVGYRGLAQLVFRDGAVKKVWCCAVDEADEFIRKEGTEQVLIHNQANPHRDGTVKTMVNAYAVAKLWNNETMYKVMDREELEAARALSKSSAYDGKFAMEMYLKTPIKRLCKLLPLKRPEIAKNIGDTIDLEDNLEDLPPSRKEFEEPAGDVYEVQTERAPIPGETVTVDYEEEKKTELPKESREEVNERIKGNWMLLEKMDALPTHDNPPEHYQAVATDKRALAYADCLSRLVLAGQSKARREERKAGVG
jgi:phage RecT family recombinase